MAIWPKLWNLIEILKFCWNSEIWYSLVWFGLVSRALNPTVGKLGGYILQNCQLQDEGGYVDRGRHRAAGAAKNICLGSTKDDKSHQNQTNFHNISLSLRGDVDNVCIICV